LLLVPNHAAILVTGMSGVGKSTALAELARCGFATVYTDEGPWIHVVDGEPLWREAMIDALLDQPRQTSLFVQGTVANQGRFYDRFDAVVLAAAYMLRCRYTCPVSAETTRTAAICSTGIDV
jgi:predicted ATPase